MILGRKVQEGYKDNVVLIVGLKPYDMDVINDKGGDKVVGRVDEDGLTEVGSNGGANYDDRIRTLILINIDTEKEIKANNVVVRLAVSKASKDGTFVLISTVHDEKLL